MAGTYFYIIILLAIGIVSFVKGLQSFLLKKMIENIPTNNIRSTAMGLVEIFGEIVPIKTMKSPLSEDKCVYYRFDVETPRSNDPDPLIEPIMKRIGIDKIASIEGKECFYVKDKTGRVLVDPSQAKIDVDYTHRLEYPNSPISEHTAIFLKERGIEFGRRNHLYVEYLLRPGDHVYLMGTAMKNPASSYSPRHVENMVVCKGRNDNIFYISNRSEKDTLSHVSWKTLAGIFGGIALIIISLASAIFLYIRLTMTA